MPWGMGGPIAALPLAVSRCAVPQVARCICAGRDCPRVGTHRTRSQCDRPGGVTREAPRDGSGVHTPKVHRQPPYPWVLCLSARCRLGRFTAVAPPGAERHRVGCRCLGRSTVLPFFLVAALALRTLRLLSTCCLHIPCSVFRCGGVSLCVWCRCPSASPSSPPRASFSPSVPLTPAAAPVVAPPAPRRARRGFFYHTKKVIFAGAILGALDFCPRKFKLTD